jgi:hypothetical protein
VVGTVAVPLQYFNDDIRGTGTSTVVLWFIGSVPTLLKVAYGKIPLEQDEQIRLVYESADCSGIASLPVANSTSSGSRSLVNKGYRLGDTLYYTDPLQALSIEVHSGKTVSFLGVVGACQTIVSSGGTTVSAAHTVSINDVGVAPFRLVP